MGKQDQNGQINQRLRNRLPYTGQIINNHLIAKSDRGCCLTLNLQRFLAVKYYSIWHFFSVSANQGQEPYMAAMVLSDREKMGNFVKELA